MCIATILISLGLAAVLAVVGLGLYGVAVIWHEQ